MDRILNVIVFYDNYDEIVSYINGLQKQKNCNIDLAVVINKDTDGNSKRIIEYCNNNSSIRICLWNFHDNVGYLNSLLNVIASISIENYKYVILSNTDIYYKSDSFFETLINTYYDNKIGCIAPSVYAKNNNAFSNPHCLHRVSKRKIRNLHFIFKHYLLAELYDFLAVQKAKFRNTGEAASCYVYSPHGCYMIFSKEFIRKICGYKYGVKLYSEESCVGELLRANNMSCFYDSKLKVVHTENSVTGKIGNRIVYRYMAESYAYILNTFY